MIKSIDPEKAAATEADRGRLAMRPRQITYRGWWDVLCRVKDQLEADNVSIVAGGLALFGLLAVFPTLTAAVAIYGLVASPEAITTQVQAFSGVLPEAASRILEEQLQTLVSRPSEQLTAGVIVGIVLAMWSARRGMVALITAMNVAYNEREHRSFLGRLAVSSVFTVGGIFGFLTLVLLGITVPIALELVPLGSAAKWVLLVVRWALLWLFAVLALSALYRFAPHRSKARWQWVNLGSAIAATLWILGSIGFAIYVRNFASFGETYGAIGGVVIMLMWFYVSAFVVILGAEINSELERQTVQDTTEGEPKPMGKRGAFSADTVGPRAGT
jgi:membrane protein